MFPTVFVSHGSPELVLQASATHRFLERLGSEIERPLAVICVSAHWEADQPTLSGAARPETIHDFFGFPKQLYDIRYPAPGAPELAREAVELLESAGLEARVNAGRGLDHGAWAPLSLMYPQADIPVIQLSVQTALGPRHHLDVGRALMALRERSVLIMGSGGATHNLREFSRYARDAASVDYAAAFDDWLEGAVTQGRQEALVNYIDEAPHARRNHPTAEHFLPLLVAQGAAGGNVNGRVIHKAFEYGVLSLAAYMWE